jgi:hypothetical protein
MRIWGFRYLSPNQHPDQAVASLVPALTVLKRVAIEKTNHQHQDDPVSTQFLPGKRTALTGYVALH